MAALYVRYCLASYTLQNAEQLLVKVIAGAGRPPSLPVMAIATAKLLALPLNITHNHIYAPRPASLSH